MWGHTIKSDNDILVKLQSKVLRILFNCYRTADAWRYCDGHINDIRCLYENVIKKLCMKNHFNILPSNFCNNTMPQINFNKLENRISRISLNQMYDYATSKMSMFLTLKLTAFISGILCHLILRYYLIYQGRIVCIRQ